MTPQLASGIPVYCAHTSIAKVAELRPHPRNPNRHPQEQIEIFAKVVRALGWRNPIVVSSLSGYIVKGHGKLAVAQFMGVDEVPVDLQKYSTEDEEWQDLLADNRIAELSEREDSAIASLLRELTAKGAQIELTGYDPREVNLLMSRLARANAADDPEPDFEHGKELLAKWKVEPGQIWGCGPHRVLCGDSTNQAQVGALLAALPPEAPKPLLMVTDPPYGVNYDPSWRQKAGVNKNLTKMGAVANDDRSDWTATWTLFRGDVAYVWHGGLHAGTVAENLVSAGFEIRGQIIWRKDRFALSRGHYHWQHEPCWYAVRKGANAHWTAQRDQTTVWDMPAREDKGHGHGTPKPIMAMRRPIENNSLIGHSVYDPFLGSGATLIAAEQTERICLGIDISPLYVAITLQRWADFANKTPILLLKT